MEIVRAALIQGLRVHPRVAQQGLGESIEARERLYASMPRVVPFGGRRPLQIIALLDWDHRLPSKQLLLRLHAQYDAVGVERIERAIDGRIADIRTRNLYPEFDVVDFADLPGDESYDVELGPELDYQAMRLVSPWRREVDAALSMAAAEAVRDSSAFAQAKASSPGRAPGLGDLETTSWMPPCESGHPRWTLDVWWLTDFDGRIGRGWSFLVDPDAAEPVVTRRPFTVRAN